MELMLCLMIYYQVAMPISTKYLRKIVGSSTILLGPSGSVCMLLPIIYTVSHISPA